jgi:hypothetical protein
MIDFLHLDVRAQDNVMRGPVVVIQQGAIDGDAGSDPVTQLFG